MIIHALGRGILFALQSFWRNIWLSVATVFVVFLALVSVNFLIAINVMGDSAIAAVKDKIDVSVYIKPEVKESKIAELKTKLEAQPDVASVQYKSADQNLEAFKSKHENDAKIQETLKELTGNPLGATLVIKAKELDKYPVILQSLDDPAYADLIEDKNYEDNQLVIQRINTIAANVRRTVLAISLIFILIAVLIVFNTVRMAIFTHQTEIGVMKLVGASNWFIRFPFIFESLISGLLAVLIAIIFVFPCLAVAQTHLSSFFSGTSFDLSGYFRHNFLMIFGLELLGVAILNVISAFVAVSKYLKV